MRKLGIYVHIPFCKKKCEYCDFISFSNEEASKERYIKCLCKDIEASKQEDCEVDTIYFGGGTPSYLEAELVAEVLEKIRSCYVVREDAEITIEVNPRYNK